MRRWAGRWGGGALAAALLAGCAARPPGAEPPGAEVPLAVPFRLAAGASAGVRGEPLVVTFGRVLEDARCPRGAQCVRAGEAVVAVVMQKRGDRAETLELRTPPGAATGAYHEYTVELAALEPAPAAGDSIPPDAYVATLVVRGRSRQRAQRS